MSTDGRVTMAEAAEAFRQIFGPPTECEHCIEIHTFDAREIHKVRSAYCRHPAAEPSREPDSFERIVGVPLDDWIAADTTDSFRTLLRRRDFSSRGGR